VSRWRPSAFVCLLLALASAPAAAQTRCPGDNGGLTLSPGFCATVFADNLGHVRHIAVAADGTVYANTWNTRYYRRVPAADEGVLVALKDKDGDGHADTVERFGPTRTSKDNGGTGIALYGGAVYAEEGDRIYRYQLAPGELAPKAAPTLVLSGLPMSGDHPMHPFIIDAKGQLFVDSASATNSCQESNRSAGSPGHQPCTEKETRAGIWRYDANKSNQVFSARERYASGIRNGEGFGIDAAGRLFVTQHGRDQLYQNWPRLFTPEQSAELPSEELMELREGADYGWPECYHDHLQGKLVLAPEYGGDGKTVGLCASRQGPVMGFPGHWAPNGLAIYLGDKFPAGYRGGAFVAFQGSWNRAPLPQAGYNVAFQPLKDGKASGPYVVFADGFAGARKEPGGAAHRPCGIAVGPDGALYVSDDVQGRIWRITYQGNGSDPVAAAGAAPNVAGGGETKRPLQTPPGATAEQVAQGERIYRGQAANGACAGCHGSDGGGSPLGPALTANRWLWSDGSVAGIAASIKKGVAQPKNARQPMPAYGGAALSDADIAAVSAYVWALSHTR
jgi:glucose/arabinose dehydrogenase